MKSIFILTVKSIVPTCTDYDSVEHHNENHYKCIKCNLHDLATVYPNILVDPFIN